MLPKVRTALVTGASGFVGSRMVRGLSRARRRVRAGMRRRAADIGIGEQVEVTPFDLLDLASMRRALKGADELYHFAALVDPRAQRSALLRANAQATRDLWQAAAEAGVQRALYCSSTAVYGLLSRSPSPLSETVRARAVEPYGYSKRMGEDAALEVGSARNMTTLVIRPAAIFGPGERSEFGDSMRQIFASRLVMPSERTDAAFSFVHVDDVVAASLFLMSAVEARERIYNVAVEPPVRGERALEALRSALRRAQGAPLRARALVELAFWTRRSPRVQRMLEAVQEGRWVSRLSETAHEMVYTSARLCRAGFRFRWLEFEDVLVSCIEGDR
jgi:nucleoside-diphosphate-sugar epimerase